LLLEDRRVPTVSIFNSFPGLDFTQSGGSVPPDTHMAVGPSHVVETVNTTMAIYNRANGSLALQTSLSSFFSSVSPGPFVFDPVVVYDELVNRFVLAILD